MHGIGVGDRVSVKLSGQEYSFVVRGVVYSPEFICVTDGVYPNPEQYGYILINTCGMPSLPLTQVLVSLSADADAQAVEKAIEAGAAHGAGGQPAGASEHRERPEQRRDVFQPDPGFSPDRLRGGGAYRDDHPHAHDRQPAPAAGHPQGAGLSVAAHPRGTTWPTRYGRRSSDRSWGVLAGHALLPNVIWALLLGQNEYPYKRYPAVSLAAWAMVALTVVMSVLICLYTYQKSARETTAELLRPKPPKAGRRILLERVGFLWRRFSFNTKMIVRNLMRNRMRTVMSFVGVLCCNALIIASLGLQDSVNALAENHYTKALCYDVRAELTLPGSTARTATAAVWTRRGAWSASWKNRSAPRSAAQSRTTLLTVVEAGQTMLRVGKNETLVEILPGGGGHHREAGPDACGIRGRYAGAVFPRRRRAGARDGDADRLQQRLPGPVYGEQDLGKPAQGRLHAYGDSAKPAHADLP